MKPVLTIIIVCMTASCTKEQDPAAASKARNTMVAQNTIVAQMHDRESRLALDMIAERLSSGEMPPFCGDPRPADDRPLCAEWADDPGINEDVINARCRAHCMWHYFRRSKYRCTRYFSQGDPACLCDDDDGPTRQAAQKSVCASLGLDR